MSVTLLLADDSITIQRVIELTFADEHVRVVSASDGQQAILKIEAEAPDIVLAYVGMPKLDGYGVAAHVKQSPSLRHIPVLLLTGAFEPIDEAKARATGCDGILVKPFKPEHLVERVRELLAGQRKPDLWPADLPRVAPAPARASAAASTVFAPPLSLAPPPALAPQPVVARPTPPPAPVTPPPPPPAPVRVVAAEPVTAEPATVVVPPPAMAPVFAEAPGSDQDMLRPASRGPQTAAASRTPLTSRELPPPVDAFESELDMLDVALSRLEPTASPQELDAATASDFARDLQALRNEQPEDMPLGEAPSPRDEFVDWDLPKPRAPITSQEHMAIGFELDAPEPVDVVPTEVPASRAPRVDVTLPPVAEPEPGVIISPQAPPAIVVRPTPWAATASVNLSAPEPTPPAPMPVRSAVIPPAPVAAPAQAPAAPLVPVAPHVPAAPSALAFATPSAPVVPPPAPRAVALPTPAVAAPPAVASPRPSLATAFSALLAAEQAQPVARAVAPDTLSESAIEDVVKRVLARMTDEAVHRVVLDAAERIIREEIERLKSPSNSSGH